jgi:hypothetical protein
MSREKGYIHHYESQLTSAMIVLASLYEVTGGSLSQYARRLEVSQGSHKTRQLKQDEDITSI